MSNPAATPKASFEAVKAAADAMAAEGLTPSIRTVMLRIGGGSPNTVTALLRRWKEERPAVEARKAIVLDERIQGLLNDQVASAVAEATKAAAAERDAALGDLADVAARGTELERELEEAQARLAELEDQVQRQTGELAAVRAELEHVRADAATAVQAAKDDAAQRGRQVQADAEVAVKKANDEASAERAKLDALNTQLGAAQAGAAEAERLRQALNAMSAQRDEQHAARMDAEKALAVATAKVQDTERLAQAAGARAEQLDGQVQQLRTDLSAAQVKAATAGAQADERATQIAALNEQIHKAAELVRGEGKAKG